MWNWLKNLFSCGDNCCLRGKCDDWDNLQQVEEEFPASKWEHIPVRSIEDVNSKIAANISSDSYDPGICFWFGPSEGVLLFRKDNSLSQVEWPNDDMVLRDSDGNPRVEYIGSGGTVLNSKTYSDLPFQLIPSCPACYPLSPEDKIRVRAYFKWLENPQSSAEFNWCSAEEEYLRKYGPESLVG